MFGLGEKKIQERRYYPMVVSEEGTEEKMSPEDDQSVWDAFEKLPQEKKDAILSSEIPQKIKLFQEKVELNDLTTGNISLTIRKIFFEELSLTDAEMSLKKVLSSSGDDVNKAQTIIDFIRNEILTIKPKPKAEETEETEEKSQLQAVTVKMPLLQALSQYEQLGNQLISQERIKIKSQSEPVRPSLLHWIKYYRDELGVGHHDSVQRGNFLFRSENGKRLSAEERERVNLVLKSVEENFPLEIDTEHSEIIFPVFHTPAPQPQPRPVQSGVAPAPQSNPAFSFGQGSMSGGTPLQAATQGGEMSFSSKHVFPAEKVAPVTPTVPSARPVSRMNQPTTANAPASPQTVPRANPFRIRPVSLGEEK